MKYRILSFFFVSSFFLLAAQIFTATPYFPLGMSAGGGKSLTQDVSGASRIALVENYQKYASAIVRSYAANRDSDPNPLALTQQAKEHLVALSVPSEFTDAHLRLVISLGLIEAGLAAHSDDIALGQTKFEEVLANEPWLTAK